jgi:hypothetical protein
VEIVGRDDLLLPATMTARGWATVVNLGGFNDETVARAVVSRREKQGEVKTVAKNEKQANNKYKTAFSSLFSVNFLWKLLQACSAIV